MINKKNIAIIGGGSSALMLACSLDKSKYQISIYEKNTALGRKFLVAGKGGFNLTHSEEIEAFVNRYHPTKFITPFVKQFTNTDFRNWLSSIGIETYVGTSKRVFPIKGMKPIEVLQAIEKKIQQNDVKIHYQHEWKGWTNDELLFETQQKLISIKPDMVVFALGGASWKVTGSDGNWLSYFESKNILMQPFIPSNCAYKINWNKNVIKLIDGIALKNCAFTCGPTSIKGEAVLTQFGIEGSAIYALSKDIRDSLLSHQRAMITIDFKPDLSLQEIKYRLESHPQLSNKSILEKKIHLTSVKIQLLKLQTTKEEYQSSEFLSQLIKAFPIELVDFSPLDDAISTVGGIDLLEVSEHLELKKLPNYFCVGEMLDWDAPTGGYLLQACFSMGYSLARYLNTQ